MTDVTAVIVARGGSVRLPGKALLPFAGSTLLGHKVRTLLAVPGVARVVVGSDSDAILAEGERCGALPLRRDAYHCDEARCSANEMIADVAARVAGDVLLWAHPTNPLVSAGTYAAALAAYCDRPPGCDSLLSVYPVRRHAWYSGSPLNYDPDRRPHTLAADCSPVWFQDGAVFIQARQRFVETTYFFGSSPVLFETPAGEVCDVDTAEDMDRARANFSSSRDAGIL